MKYVWHAQPLQLLANTAGKVAIAALLVTLHGPKFARAKSVFIWTLAGIQTIIVVVAIAMIYAQCKPVAKLWRVTLPGTCDGRMRNRNFAYVQGGVSSFVDLALAIYPIVLFWDLQVKLAKKLVLSLLFAFGIVACICAIIRTVNLSTLGQTQDITHAVAELVIWNTTEMYLVLLAGSLPGLRPLFNKRMRTSSHRNSSYGYLPRQSNQSNKKHIVMKLSSLPSGRSKAYASSSNQNDGGSTENILNNMGHGNIMKTTEVNVRSGRNSIRGQTPSNHGDEQHGTVQSDLAIARDPA
ncbi:MAG: hypothetical protein Q9225_004364 [Loekoesia sp. 1 TL-2023]